MEEERTVLSNESRCTPDLDMLSLCYGDELAIRRELNVTDFALESELRENDTLEEVND
jgi:hypothetical protein